MAILGYSKSEFGQKLDTVVSAAHPVRSIQYLKGRDEQLEEIERALFASGRHIFIYGDRGVGKSSLAATAAYQYQSSDGVPIFVSGSSDETFNSIIVNLTVQAIQQSKIESVRKRQELSLRISGVGWGAAEEKNIIDLAEKVRSVGDAAELLKEVAARHSEKPTVVLDEFDAIPSQVERGKFASLLKQLGDQSVGIKFFITGVGRSCDELLGAHQSAHRQLATVPLDRLPWEARREIVISAAEAFNLNVDNDVNWRIAIVSDGFPYYIHLIVEKMLWEAFDSEETVTTLTWEHFYAGLRVAIRETNAELRRPYEKAVLSRSENYENVVWSTADGDDLQRSLSDMHFSFKRIVSKRGMADELDSKKYGEIIRKLRQPSHGEILQQVGNRAGWYEYREKMLRGYVRMQAEANEIELSGEREAPKQKMHIGNIRTGIRGPSIPRGVSVNKSINRIGENDDE